MIRIFFTPIFILLFLMVASSNGFKFVCNEKNDISVCFNDGVKQMSRYDYNLSLILNSVPYTLGNSINLSGDRSIKSFLLMGVGTEHTKVNLNNNHEVEYFIAASNMKNVTFKNLNFEAEQSDTNNGDNLDHIFDNFILSNISFINIINCKFEHLHGRIFNISAVSMYNEITISNSLFMGIPKTHLKMNKRALAFEIITKKSNGTLININNCKFHNFRVGNIYPNYTSMSISKMKDVREIAKNLHTLGINFRDSKNDNKKKVCISNCTFLNNKGYIGGGISIYTTQVSNGLFEIKDCEFKNNKVYDLFPRTLHTKSDKSTTRYNQVTQLTGAGGGIAGFLFTCTNCTVTIFKCMFQQNNATLGGGVKLGFYYKSFKVFFKIENSTFLNNSADSGSGLYLESQLEHPSIPKSAELIDLIFINNTARGFGSGIFVAYLPLILNGSSLNFTYNKNTAFAVISSQIKVYANLFFYNNTGERGGAIFLSDNSQLLLNDSVNLHFEKNYASEKGGAIYADSISLDLLYRNYGYTFYNVHCFIKHFIKFSKATPDEYTQNITFYKNKAGKAGSAIYTHTLSPCSWNSTSKPYHSITSALKWKTYKYTNCPHDDIPPISTAVATYFISLNNISKIADISDAHNTKIFQFQPGIPLRVTFVAYDQLKSIDVSIATVQSHDPKLVSPCNKQDSGSIFITSASEPKNQVELSMCGKVSPNPDASTKIYFKALDGLTIEHFINVVLIDCPLGKYLDQLDQKCKCYRNMSELGHGENFWWGSLNTSRVDYNNSKNNAKKVFSKSSCVPGFCQKENGDKYNLTAEKFSCIGGDSYYQYLGSNEHSVSIQCVGLRNGLGCSQCKNQNNSTFFIYSGTLRCGHCEPKQKIIHSALVILGIIFFVLVLYFFNGTHRLQKKINKCVFPYLRTFILFSQGVFIIYLNYFLDTFESINNPFYISKLHHFISKTGLFLSYDLCFTFGHYSMDKHLSPFRVIEEYYIYLIGFVAIIVIGICLFFITQVCKGKFSYKMLNRVLISYIYLTYIPVAFITLRLLSFGKVTTFNPESGLKNPVDIVWNFNPQHKWYYGSLHFSYTVIAFLVMFLYLVPLPVILMSFGVYSVIMSYLKNNPNVVNTSLQASEERNKFCSNVISCFVKIWTACKPVHFRLFECFKKLSTIYGNSFGENYFAIWIPGTLIFYFLLLVLQLSGQFFQLESYKQSQFMAVFCFFFLYLRVTFRISRESCLQFYDCLAVLFLAISCIMIIIDSDIYTVNRNQVDTIVRNIYIIPFIFFFTLLALLIILPFFHIIPKSKNRYHTICEKFCFNRKSDENRDVLREPLLSGSTNSLINSDDKNDDLNYVSARNFQVADSQHFSMNSRTVLQKSNININNNNNNNNSNSNHNRTSFGRVVNEVKPQKQVLFNQTVEIPEDDDVDD